MLTNEQIDAIKRITIAGQGLLSCTPEEFEQLCAQAKLANAQEPVAWLKEWTTDAGEHKRVDLQEGNEVWLAKCDPVITPLCAAQSPSAGRVS